MISFPIHKLTRHPMGYLRRQLLQGRRITIHNSFSRGKGCRVKGLIVDAYLNGGPVPVRVVQNMGYSVLVEAESGWLKKQLLVVESIGRHARQVHSSFL